MAAAYHRPCALAASIANPYKSGLAPMDLSSLNPAQREAVLHTEGPLLVLAGAGSGKTRVITHRIAHLLEQGVGPEQIVALSFTNKAAEEMRERIAKMVGQKRAKALQLGTFHSLGSWMMREDPKGFDVPKRFQILDQGDVFGIIRALLRDHGYHGPANKKRFDINAIVQRISLWKNDFLDTQAVRKIISSNDYDEIAAELFEPYEDRLRSLAAVDFDDLVCRIASRLQEDPATKRRWQRRFRYLLVDEYQDTNTAQFQMLLELLGEEQNLCVVGDDDQAIYGWRGAKVANILGFDMYFRNAKVVKLEANYRSKPPITTCANTLIAHNTARHDKQLIPQRRGDEPVQIVVTPDGPMEAKWVADKILTLVKERQAPPREIAVLYRSSRQARIVEQNLQEHGLPYRVLGGQPFYDKKEVKDATAYLKLLVMPSDEIAVRRALDTPNRGIGRKTVERLDRWAELNGRRLIDAVYHADEIEGLSGRPLHALQQFAQQIRHAQGEAHHGSVADALRALLREVRLRDNMVKEVGSGEAAKNRWSGVEFLLESVSRYEQRAWEQRGSKQNPEGKPKWRDYLGNLDLKKKDEGEGEDAGQGQITLSTFHSAKGLEWGCVFILGVEEGTMPHKRTDAPRLSDAISGDIEEERRLFYVGITRARDRLWLTRAATRVDRGRELEIRPSRFLEELPGDDSGVIAHYDVREQEKLSQESMEEMASAFMNQLQAFAPADGPARSS
ncbi:UvrD-helicase domain-containing protein [Pseudenhygromyxa sp. WMMC2535]|uniref:ATP-dependent helicase n=1 Tax=Pseudenhygromyxa sp. WMMC2535 TaxID=2712867 RepID=UPI001595A56A|nr:UvrD-helicase domain-containing protein [Pseudenhygromyxa sp. WMMC2535]NVB39943.1 UvrD-helicase domain-containing protein [Pseudenhygromyxa sp. WMMC2535]